MTVLLSPVIPSSARLPARGPGRPGAARRLPVAAVPAVPSAPQDVIYGLGRMDSSGRVADRAALGLEPGAANRARLLAAEGLAGEHQDEEPARGD